MGEGEVDTNHYLILENFSPTLPPTQHFAQRYVSSEKSVFTLGGVGISGQFPRIVCESDISVIRATFYHRELEP